MMKKFTAVLLFLCLLACLCAGCAGGSPSHGQSSSVPSQKEESAPSASIPTPEAPSPEDDPVETEPEESSAPESPAPSEDPAPDPEPQPSSSGSEVIQPAAVPHGAELDSVDFSAMGKDELIALLQPVLNKAGFFCKLGWLDGLDRALGVEVDFSPEEALAIPYQDFGFNRDFYPCLNLSYQTMDELRRDIGTVFTPDVLEDRLQIVFDNYIDHEGRLYVYGGGGYSVERNWKLDEMTVVTAGGKNLTISAPVSVWGPTSDEFFTAHLNFEIKDGYIVMDSSYFANKAS